jgi:hypothetical protein
VDATIGILDGVIHNLTRGFSSQTTIRHERVGVEARTSLNVLFDFGLQVSLLRLETMAVRTCPPGSNIPITAVLSLPLVPVMRRWRLLMCNLIATNSVLAGCN